MNRSAFLKWAGGGLVLGYLAGDLQAARPPEWVAQALATPPTGTGHSAVVLLRSADIHFVADDRVRRVYRGAIKILSEHGRARAICTHVLNPTVEKIISAKAWVVSPDGRSSDTFPTSEFADTPLPVGNQFWLHQRLIMFSAASRIALKGVLAWEIQLESSASVADINWSFDAELPVELNVLEIAPPAGGSIDWYASTSRIPGPVAGRTPGALRWEFRGISPPKGEVPEAFLPEPMLVFARGVAATSAKGARTWAEFARLAADVIEPRMIPTPELKVRAERIVAGKTTRWDRVRALAEFVQRDIAYLSVTLDRDYLAGYRPQPAGDVLKNRYGDCKDKVALLIALLRAVGEEGVPVLVMAGDPTWVREEWPAAMFNHVIAGLPADEAVPASWPVVDAGEAGRLVLFDPTDRHTPLGFLSAGDQTGRGLVASPRASGLIRLPAGNKSDSHYRCTITASLSPNGDLVTKGEEMTRGQIAIAQQRIREPQTAEQAKRSFEARLREGSAIVRGLSWSENRDVRQAEASVAFAFEASRYGRRAGTLLLVSPQVLFALPRLAPWKTTQPGVAWMMAGEIEKSVSIEFPAGAAIEEIPEDLTLEQADAKGTLSYRQEGSRLIYRFRFTQDGGLLRREEYEARRDMVQKLLDAERRPVVLRVSEIKG